MMRSPVALLCNAPVRNRSLRAKLNRQRHEKSRLTERSHSANPRCGTGPQQGAASVTEPRQSRTALTVFNRPVVGVLVFVLLGGLASLAMGIDTNWDLRNYHFYNPWAWLNHRIDVDYAPAQLQSYHSPFLDLPFYAMVKAGIPAIIICFLMGAPFGVAAYFFVRIAHLVIQDLGITHEKQALVAIGFVALTGAAGKSQIGSTMNEWATASIVMAALFVLLRAGQLDGRLTVRAATISGMLLGLSVGLKLTAAIFALAVPIGLVSWWWRRRADWRGMLAFSVAGLAGFLISYGYWGFVLWTHFRNPFFPYFNNLVRSPYWEPARLLDQRFLPDSYVHWIVLPFRIARYNSLTTEETMRDPRLALLFAVSAALLIMTVARARATPGRFFESVRGRMPASVLLLAAFVGVSYVAWLVMFSIYRYTIPLELIGSLLLVLAVRACVARMSQANAIVAAFCLLVVAATVAPNWGRARLHRGRYIAVQMPAMPERSLVMVLNHEPLSYLVPFMGRGTRVVRPVSNFTDPTHANRFERDMAALIATYDGPMFDLRYAGALEPGEERALQAYALDRDDTACRPIESNLESRTLLMCPMRRRASGRVASRVP